MLEEDLPRLPAGLDVGVRGKEGPQSGAWISRAAGGVEWGGSGGQEGQSPSLIPIPDCLNLRLQQVSNMCCGLSLLPFLQSRWQEKEEGQASEAGIVLSTFSPAVGSPWPCRSLPPTPGSLCSALNQSQLSTVY